MLFYFSGSRRANHAQSVNHLLAEINGSTCEQKPGQIINSFIQKVNGILGDKLGPCKPPCKCSLPSVNISESCTDRRLRLRRSDASLTSATSATESVGSDVHVEVSTGNFSLAFAVRATLNDAAIQSSITKSEQKEIIEILDEVYYNMTQTIADGQFTWQAEDHLVTAVALKSDGPKFVDFNCASNEVSQVTEKSAACCEF